MHPNDALQEVSADEIGEGSVADVPASLDEVSGSVSTVDQLDGRLSKLQDAMDQVQRGDLDAAEVSVAALEENVVDHGEEE